MLLAATADGDAGVRSAAMAALAQSAGPAQIAAMVQGLLKAEKGPQREAAEKAIMAVCLRVRNPNKRRRPSAAGPAWAKTAARCCCPPWAASADRASCKSWRRPSPTAVRSDTRPGCALCDWPDASVAARLLKLVETSGDAVGRTAAAPGIDSRGGAARHPQRRCQARPLAQGHGPGHARRGAQPGAGPRPGGPHDRVAPLPDALSGQALAAQTAAASVVELAHHRKLREPNKAEFDRALDAVIRISKDPGVVDQAKRYKKGQTSAAAPLNPCPLTPCPSPGGRGETGALRFVPPYALRVSRLFARRRKDGRAGAWNPAGAPAPAPP